mmetsp:Transcript_4878/g.7971  ORF Transcript_4878/g.7971 Transcript_4878/m.7971 type:complete len:377 (+) Transcript_4878:293-1423(+)
MMACRFDSISPQANPLFAPFRTLCTCVSQPFRMGARVTTSVVSSPPKEDDQSTKRKNVVVWEKQPKDSKPVPNENVRLLEDEEDPAVVYDPEDRLARFYCGCCACHYAPLYDLKSVKLVYRWEAPTGTLEKYVQVAYRPQLTFLQCLASMFWWHNETINIWSALVLAIMNLWWIEQGIEQHPGMGLDVQAILWLHGCLRSFCWLASWTFHTFMPMDPGTSSYLCIFDYAGCFITILGYGTSTVYLNLYCYPVWLVLCEIVGAVLIFLAILLSILPEYQKEESRQVRVWVSVACVVPYVIGLYGANVLENGWFHTSPQYYYLLYAFAFEIVAVFFYASMVPERVTNIFDVALNSHSIWHCLNMGFDYYIVVMGKLVR